MVNIKADLLESTKNSLNIELHLRPINPTFENYLEQLRSVIDYEHTSQLGTLCSSNFHIQ